MSIRELLRLIIIASVGSLSACDCGPSAPTDAEADAEADAGADSSTMDSGSVDSSAEDSASADSGPCSGLPDGTACGSAVSSACDGADTCLAGVCVTNVLADGSACGDATATSCTAPDTCLAGVCQSNHAMDGASCGDTSTTECSAPDSCLAGVCESNHAQGGSYCGDPSTSECTGPDVCIEGVCLSGDAEDGAPCGDHATTECTLPDSCLAGVCTANHAMDGSSCGDPSSGECTLADSCLAGVCATNDAAPGAPCGSATSTQCDAPDACDGLGACLPRARPDGLSCYDCVDAGGLCGACTSGACPNAPACAIDPSTVATPIINNNGQDGNMFDITATNTVTITGFEGNIANTPNSVTTYYVYYKVGTHVGFETNAAAWTLLAGPIDLTPNAPNTLTTVVSGLAITIPAGETYAFYLTNTSAASNNNRYHNGTATGNVLAADGNITVKEGAGGAYPFGSFFNARAWEGVVHYEPVIQTSATGAVASDGVMFDVVATDALWVSSLGVHLEAGTFPLSVYFRRGSHVAAETVPDGWTLLGSEMTVTSSGPSALTTIPFSTDVFLESGDTGAFYFTTGAGSSGILSSVGTSIGNIAASDSTLSVLEGLAVSELFGEAGAVSVGEVRISYGVCGP